MAKDKIIEDITRSDITSAIDSKISSSDFKKKVKEICAEVLADMYKSMWQKKSFWKGDVTHG